MDFFKSREFKIYISIVAAVSILAFVITAAVFLPGYLRYHRIEQQKKMDNTISNRGKKLDFLIPKEHSKLINPAWKSYYSGHKWTEEELSKYWKDPDAMLLEYLDNKNTALINDILGKYE